MSKPCDMNKTQSDGSTASYYELPTNATELQHLISHRDMNAQAELERLELSNETTKDS